MDKDKLDPLIEAELASGALQYCPAGCIVQKMDGCNFMDCKCGKKFCWNCKREKGPAADQCPYQNAVCNSH